MKKNILFILGLILCSLPTLADTRAQALLLHNGEGKSFDADQLQQAVNEAVNGDTICLSEGTFQPGTIDTLLVDKAVSLMGAGGDVTKIVRYINIAIDGKQQFDNFKISGIHTNSIIVSKQMRGIKISQCFMDGYFTATDSVVGVEMDRCFMRGFIPTKFVRSASVYSSCIAEVGEMYGNNRNPYYFDSAGCDLLFMNCLIGIVGVNQIHTSSDNGGRVRDATFMNCIIDNVSNWDNSQEYNTYVNCLVKKALASGNMISNCYVDGNLQVTTDSQNSYFPIGKINKEDITNALLLEKGYIGTDGTAVGAYGGSNPYSLEAEGISVKEGVLKVDPATRQLNVTLKLSTE